ncbi:short-chain dehydrogenase [Frankia sp. R43]|uniref:SDR family NAD(P)-dependent oxidoreductase n=1 Tax=Frankia sp. R43 TaxID=269536 RepID=UPI0006CA2425|nr:SDR family oxidoreductase [Frankia sp. R43]KPM50995.1 short-chain dehydrogenase [Frankia sp. R43]
MTASFEGKAALITGAGSGMGRAIALRLAGQGASVLGIDIDEGRLAETKTQALAPTTGRLSVRQADISDPAACAEAVAAAVAEFGRLDVLGNVAGIYLAEHTTKMPVEQYRRVMGVNLDGCFFLAQAAIPHLLETDGTIINIASNSGLQGVPYSAAYSMSKGGLIALTRSLAVEYLKTRLRVNAIAPAGTRTNIATSGTFPSDVDPDLARRMGGLRGLAEPEEIAALFAFLASDEARSITGAVYTVDNGLTVS